MNRRLARLATAVTVLGIVACGRSVQPIVQGGMPAVGPRTPSEQAAADSGRMPYTRADVDFMQGMIGHHAQAVEMAAWAATNGARHDVRILAARIDVSQRDEIAFMQRWLRERHEMVPDANGRHQMNGHDMAGMTMMPGMLTPAQMAQLSVASGPEFDRLFLTFMIQHHQGAITMVETLFGSTGAGQDLYIFRFASDVNADQATEIERMQSMLSSAPLHHLDAAK